MLNIIKSKKANAVLVIRANRISRNPIDAGQIISLMDEKKLLFIRTPHSTSYTGSSTDKMMLGLELIFSKKDSDDKGEMVKEGQKSKALKGTPHGISTLGFLNDRSEEKGNRKWMIDDSRFWKIEKLFELFLTGNYSAGRLYEYAVNELKLTTVKRKNTGGNPISISRIYEILKDPVYAGFFFYDNEEYTLDKNLPRAITREQHEKVKRLLSRNNISKFKTHEPIYSDFLTSESGDFMGQDIKNQLICDCKHKFSYKNKDACPECNKEISNIENPKYLDKNYYYNVKLKKSKRLEKGVKVRSIEEKEITKKILETVAIINKAPEQIMSWAKKFIHEVKDKEFSDILNLEKNKGSRKLEYEARKKQMRNRLYSEQVSESEYKEDLAQLESDYSDVKSSEEDSSLNKKIDWTMEIENKIQLVNNLEKLFEDLPVKEKRLLLSKLGSNLTWNEKELCIHNTNSVNALIEAIKVSKQKYDKFEPVKELENKGLNRKISPILTDFSTLLPVLDEFRTVNWGKIESDLRFSGLTKMFQIRELQN